MQKSKTTKKVSAIRKTMVFKNSNSQAFKLLAELPDDFMKDGRHDPLAQKRKF